MFYRNEHYMSISHMALIVANSIKLQEHILKSSLAQSAGAIENTDCIFAER